MSAQEVFWRSKSLEEMSSTEWESLCDGCALCCLHKLEEEDTKEVFYTTVVCNLLDFDTCRCTKYEERCTLVPDCVKLTPKDVDAFHWLPPSCAYRLVHEGKDLPEWHPLVSADQATVIESGASVLSWYEVKDNEIEVEDYVDYIIE